MRVLILRFNPFWALNMWRAAPGAEFEGDCRRLGAGHSRHFVLIGVQGSIHPTTTPAQDKT